MPALTPFGPLPLIADCAAHALVATWLRRRVFRSTSPTIRVAVAIEVAVVGAVLPLASSLDSRVVAPWIGALFAAAAIANFTSLVALPCVALAELVAWFVTRRRAPAGALPASDATASIASMAAIASVEAPQKAEIEPTRRAAIATIGGVGSLALAGVPLAWGSARTRFDIETTEIAIRIARLPKALDGFSIVQVSDIHVGHFLEEAQLKVAEDFVARLRPDLVVATGDLVQHRAVYAPMAAAWLARLKTKARHGIAVIPGNHEHYAGLEAVLGEVRRAGCDVLFNDARIVAPGDAGGFGLVGVDDLAGLHVAGGGPKLGKALTKVRPDHARVLLCHQPSFHAVAAAFGFDLMLSGHTHGGQIAPVGPISVGTTFRNIAGLSQIGDTRLYVNRGLGTSGPPSRVQIRPEITKIVLVAA